MPIYKVIRKEINYQYTFIEADTQDQAQDIADEIGGEDCWRDTQSYECEIDRIEEADPSETIGVYIQTADDSYLKEK